MDSTIAHALYQLKIASEMESSVIASPAQYDERDPWQQMLARKARANRVALVQRVNTRRETVSALRAALAAYHINVMDMLHTHSSVHQVEVPHAPNAYNEIERLSKELSVL